MPSSSCILYQNEDKTVILLDIPRSLELAQEIPEEPCLRRLISCKPLEKPFPSLEPKSAKAKAKFGETSIKSLLLEKHIQLSLEEVKKQHTGPWHFPRFISDGEEEPPRKRKRGNSETLLDDGETLDTSLLSLHSSLETKHNLDEITILSIPEIPEFYWNSSPKTIILAPTNLEPRNSIHIPPNSTFINRFITDSSSFLLPNGTAFPDKNFNLILLDPPWPNRSVLRKANYSTSPSPSTLRSLLSSIPIPSLLAPNGITALWITNKPAFHALILEPGGMFEQWGVELVEEWVWVKVTKDGEFMSEINGSWRKPYEILLVGRKMHDGVGKKGGAETGEYEVGVKRRVLFAVPDIHSRKPNLKELFERSGLLPRAVSYEALEIFARNMTAGWWAWGDEVVEFQKDEYWVTYFDNSDPS